MNTGTTGRGHPPPGPWHAIHLERVRAVLPRSGYYPVDGIDRDAYDNAKAESAFANIKTELLARRRFPSQAKARMATFEWL